jgi:hypothetical protein
MGTPNLVSTFTNPHFQRLFHLRPPLSGGILIEKEWLTNGYFEPGFIDLIIHDTGSLFYSQNGRGERVPSKLKNGCECKQRNVCYTYAATGNIEEPNIGSAH